MSCRNNPICGVYIILHKSSGKVYVGSSTNVQARIWTHVCALKKGRHGNPYLQAVWNKYGSDDMEFKIVHICSKERRVGMEVVLVDSFMSMDRDHGFNLRHPRTMQHSEETKKRIGDMKRGKSIKMPPRSIEHTMNLSKAFRGRKLSQSHKEKIRANATRGGDSPTCKYPDSVCKGVIPLFQAKLPRSIIALELGIPVWLVRNVITGKRKFANKNHNDA